MPVPRRMSVVQRTTMRAVALGAAAGLSVGGAATAASASESTSSGEAPATTQSLTIVSPDNVQDDLLDDEDQ